MAALARVCLSQRIGTCAAGRWARCQAFGRPAFRSVAQPISRRGFSTEPKSGSSNPWNRFWKWTSQERPHWRESYREAAVIFCVFGCVGSTSVKVCRPIIQNYIVDGTMKDGPWSYRIANIVAVTPVYLCILVTFGTLAGRNRFFTFMAKRIISHFVPKSLRPQWLQTTPAMTKVAGEHAAKATAATTASATVAKGAGDTTAKAAGETATKVVGDTTAKAAGGRAGE